MNTDLALVLAEHISQDGVRSTPIKGLHLYRESFANKTIPEVVGPTLALVAQGKKRLTLGDFACDYDSSSFLLLSFNLPVAGAVIEASRSRPYLGFRLDLDTELLFELGRVPLGKEIQEDSVQGLHVGSLTADLLAPVLRLVKLLATPKDIEVLAPLYHKEILYRLLKGPQGVHLRRLVEKNSHTHRIAEATAWLKSNLSAPIAIPALAKVAKMSPSSFRQSFCASIGMTPLQFQKRLRLQEARRLMLVHAKDVTSARILVGYRSSSHFNRDYKQVYGDSPLREIGRQRKSNSEVNDPDLRDRTRR